MQNDRGCGRRVRLSSRTNSILVRGAYKFDHAGKRILKRKARGLNSSSSNRRRVLAICWLRTARTGPERSWGEGSQRKQRNNPMPLDMRQAPRCRARTRRGSPCQSSAMQNGRCRMHGGTSPGAPKGNRNAFKHGRYTAEAIARRLEIRELLRAMKALANTGERM